MLMGWPDVAASVLVNSDWIINVQDHVPFFIKSVSLDKGGNDFMKVHLLLTVASPRLND